MIIHALKFKGSNSINHSAIKLFNAMYSLLEGAYKKDNSNELLVYISDANPTVCLDGKSLDPAVFEDFERAIANI